MVNYNSMIRLTSSGWLSTCPSGPVIPRSKSFFCSWDYKQKQQWIQAWRKRQLDGKTLVYFI